MSCTVTKTNEPDSKVKDKSKELKAATGSNDLDEVLENVKKIDVTCCFTKCKTKTNSFGIDCKYCGGRFCTSHGLPEVHGCGEAVRRDEKRKYLHPDTKLSDDKHTQAQSKLNMKLKQMQSERKSKQGFQSKGKKK